jgi:dTMP kinase
VDDDALGSDLADSGGRALYRRLLQRPTFRRFFIGQCASSLGDWIGLIATVALVKRIYNDEFALAAVLLARIGPSLLFSPIAGVLADRWDRRRVMVTCDLARAGLIAFLPFIETVSSRVPVLSPVLLLFIISALLEMLTLAWQPAKDSSVPDMLDDPRLYTHAYSLLLLAAYATFPLSGAFFGLITKLSGSIGSALGLRQLALNPEHLAFFLDAVTFIVSAGLTLTLRIPPRPVSKLRLDVKAVWREMVAGLRFVFGHKLIRPWVIGIGGAFAGIGTFIALAPFFLSEVLGGGPSSFGFLITAVGVGLGTGFLLAGPSALTIPKDLIFSIAVISMGIGLFVFGTLSTLSTALLAAGICGTFAGFAYPSGYALIQENLEQSLRGRASSAINSVIRLAIVGASAITPVLVKIIDKTVPNPLVILDQQVDIRGIRVAMWVGGLFIFTAGVVTTNAVRAGRRHDTDHAGIFIVFEGGEGAGKTTQIELLRQFLADKGREVVVTHEPGATGIGARLRDLLLDPASSGMSAKAEALLYAADRAQHVDETIRPALAGGAIVICDRYVDSSIAYQGFVRGLGEAQIRTLNRWGTAGLNPDLVFLLDLDAQRGLDRAEGSDRIESEGHEFHARVREAYRTLARAQRDRFFVIDAALTKQEVAKKIRSRVLPLLESAAKIPAIRPSLEAEALEP